MEGLTKALRKHRGKLSLAKAAAELEVTEMTYSMWERGVWEPKRDAWEKLRKWLGVSPIEFAVLLGVIPEPRGRKKVAS